MDVPRMLGHNNRLRNVCTYYFSDDMVIEAAEGIDGCSEDPNEANHLT
jgi:hypothetical protein